MKSMTSRVLLLLLLPLSLRAEVKLAPLFQDGAVLQQGKPINVFGQANPGESVSVEFKGQKATATAEANGRWLATLPAVQASSEPAELIVTGKNRIALKDIVVGEVWLCSGQSNMAFLTKTALNFDQEAANANYPLIRHFKVKLAAADQPLLTCEGAWIPASPTTVGDFSAPAYFFARELFQKLNVPIGLINASYGGTPVESWTSAQGLAGGPYGPLIAKRWADVLAVYPEQEKLYKERLAKWNEAKKAGEKTTFRPPRRPDGPGGRMTPSGLFNAMVNPLIPYTVQGVIWYQGEANSTRASEYSGLFTSMIKQWRQDFGQGDLPFYFVQLANLERRVDTTDQQWAFQREAQATALKLPVSGMAVAADIGDPANIHPKNKQEVGRRLSLIALANIYGKGGEYAGPQLKETRKEGTDYHLSFDHAEGLNLKSDTSFEIAGADKVFHPAKAKVEGCTLIVTSAAVTDPASVRYAWKNNPALVLYNGAGLPAPPFRTDNWPAQQAAANSAEETETTP